MTHILFFFFLLFNQVYKQMLQYQKIVELWKDNYVEHKNREGDRRISRGQDLVN